MKNLLLCVLALSGFFHHSALADPCTPQGNPAVYGTNDVWIGYVYDNYNLTDYRGYVTEGAPGNPNFQNTFGGALVNYPTNGCAVFTEAFSIRYRLIKTFVPGTYDITISGDDGYRLSFDGGATWTINNWSYLGNQKNTVTTDLAGTYNMVLEYFDYAHNNSISFNVSPACLGSENTGIYGTGNVWRGYVYNGFNFEYFKGIKNEGSAESPNFDQNFGGNHVRFNTSSCGLLTEHFSIRYRLTRNFSAGLYSFILGSEDGYRFSVDGGTTWLIDRWNNLGYTASSAQVNLNGSYNMVLEYRENTGPNRIMFSVGAMSTLPVTLISFTGKQLSQGVLLDWKVGEGKNDTKFDVEKSKDASSYELTGTVSGKEGVNSYTFTDRTQQDGWSYYRLKITNEDGSVKYSQPIRLGRGQNDTRIFPTLVTNHIIHIENHRPLALAAVLVIDMSGRTVMHRKLASLSAMQVTTINLDDTQHLKGMYLVQLTENGEPVKTEMIVVR